MTYDYDSMRATSALLARIADRCGGTEQEIREGRLLALMSAAALARGEVRQEILQLVAKLFPEVSAN